MKSLLIRSLVSTAYEFMDPSSHPIHVVLYVIGIALAECLVFVVIHVVMVLRHRLTHRAAHYSGDSRIPSPSQEMIEGKSSFGSVSA